MSYTLIFNSEAEKEYSAAYQWYEGQQPGLGERFLQETEHQIQKIIANPEAYHLSKGNYRESLVGHFPFTVVYAIAKRKKTIYISSIFHTSRDPKGKYRR